MSLLGPKRRLGILIAVMAAALAIGASTASAEFHIVGFNGLIANQDGTTNSRAAAHPYSITTNLEFSAADFLQPDGNAKDVEVSLPPGFIANPGVVPSACSQVELFGVGAGSTCPAGSQVGVATVLVAVGPNTSAKFIYPATGVYKMVPRPGQPTLLGFNAGPQFPIYLVPKLRSDGDYGFTVASPDTNANGFATGAEVTIWGVPSDSSHDADRGNSPGQTPNFFNACAELADPACSNTAGYGRKAFLTNPSNCSAGPLTTGLRVNSWQAPTTVLAASFDHDINGNSTAITGCADVPFDPTIAVQPSTDSAETPTGLNFELEIPSNGLINPDGLAQANVKKAEVRLPAGISINPSAAEGLGACTPADFARESATSPQGAGCSNSSRVGTVRIDTPLLEDPVNGSAYLAEQDDPATTTSGAENPFDTLLALYIVAKDAERNVLVKLAGKVSPDPLTGQLMTTFDDLPQLPFEKFTLKFREGQRSPLSSPARCGIYEVQADFVPWSAADPDNPTPAEINHTTSRFKVTRGVGGGPCPSGGLPTFRPDLVAGTLNNAAGSYSPFNIRLSRNDGEQEFTNFSIKLPPGIVAKLAGVPFCSDGAIAAAKSRTGTDELTSPSCPAASAVGKTLVGAGVGSVLTYVPGKVYLAGPYHGSALSIVAITAAKVGPFDLGTVVIRQALKVDPVTAEVFVDSVGSDPIPHIIDGLPVHARDIRVYVDRPEFVLNPTSCDPTSTASTLLGSGLDFASAADDLPVTVASPFQAANCANLHFKPKLALSVSGATKRSGNPAFKAVLTMKPGEANIARAEVSLPVSEFLDNAHIATVCTRVQYRAAQCPPDSVYGYARAFTPLLDEPLEGPVYLRSSEHKLPDLVAALHSGKINIDLAGRVDSVGKGQIRNTFEVVPDAPVSKFVLEMAGGKKGLLENSRNLCQHRYRATAKFDGQNGKTHDFKPLVRAKCGQGAKKQRRPS